MLKRTTTAAVLLLALGSGCMKKIQVNGIEVYDAIWRRTHQAVERKASFELSCSAESLELSLLHREGREPTEVAVTGCGRRALFQRSVLTANGVSVMSDWHLSSIVDGAAPRRRGSDL